MLSVPKFFNRGLADGFDAPVAEPGESQSDSWQSANRQWWEAHPMTYEWGEGIASEPGSQGWFEDIDRLFLKAASTYLKSSSQPFDTLIPYAELAKMDVLEIGVGAGTHAELIARQAKTFTGIDITQNAVALTRQRFDLAGLTGEIKQMDAEHLGFSDESFDFVWSWGVIHHSSHTSQVVREIARVLRPKGKAVVMVYHRSFWWYYVVNGFIRGLLLGDLLRTRSLHRTVQRGIDGAIARFYTPAEWRALSAEYLPVTRLEIFGDKAEMVPLPAGRLKSTVLRIIPNSFSRLFLGRLRQGYFLVAHHQRA
jgi:2-polyprenyl-3-methyl-5-hydroxy-6-metoxy-1,4-benzoquinol methylase